jgi:hypothetical protein
LGIVAATGATSAGTAGGKGGDLGLSAGAGGAGTAAANGGSVILRPGNGFAPGVSGLVRVTNGPLVTSGGLLDIGAATTTLTVTQIRGGVLSGAPTSGGQIYTLPTAGDILTAFPGLQLGDRIEFSVSNLSATQSSTLQAPGPAITSLGSANSRQITVTDHAGRFALVATNVTVATFDFLRIA